MNGKFMLDLKNRLCGNSNKINRDLVRFSSFGDSGTLRLSECTIEDILPNLLVYSSMATIGSREKMWIATSMLARFLETFTNNLVVMEDEKPVGILGGQEVIGRLSKNPTNSFFSDFVTNQVMNKDLHITTPETKVQDMLKKMQKINRDFALIENKEGEFSTISARRLLEVGIMCETPMMVSEITSKLVPTFNQEDTIGTIIEKMIQHDSEILILENTPQFANPQIILEKVVELNYLDETSNFFDMKATSLNLQKSKLVSENTTIPDMCKIMLSMKYSFVMTSNMVLTPWDLISALR